MVKDGDIDANAAQSLISMTIDISDIINIEDNGDDNVAIAMNSDGDINMNR